MTERVDFKCPFCGRWAAAEMTGDGDPTTLHALPPCQKYLNLNPHEYVVAVNQLVRRPVFN